MSTDRWMDKEDAIHIYNGILLNYKNEWNGAICNNMDEHDCHARQSKYHIMSHMWNLKCDTKEHTHIVETDSQT